MDCVEDVIEELAPQLHNGGGVAAGARVNPGKALPEVEANRAAELARLFAGKGQQFETVIRHLNSSERIHIDSIVESSGLSAQTVLGVLLELELTGLVVQHPGKLFSLAQI